MVCLYKKNEGRQNPYLRIQSNTIYIIKYFQSRVYKAKNLDLKLDIFKCLKEEMFSTYTRFSASRVTRT